MVLSPIKRDINVYHLLQNNNDYAVQRFFSLDYQMDIILNIDIVITKPENKYLNILLQVFWSLIVLLNISIPLTNSFFTLKIFIQF